MFLTPLMEVDELFYEVNNVRLRSIIKGKPYKVIFSRILIWNKCKYTFVVRQMVWSLKKKHRIQCEEEPEFVTLSHLFLFTFHFPNNTVTSSI